MQIVIKKILRLPPTSLLRIEKTHNIVCINKHRNNNDNILIRNCNIDKFNYLGRII